MSSEADVEAVREALQWAEGEGLEADALAALARISDLLQRYEAALRDIANYYAYCRDTQGEGDSPCARRAREALALDSPATQETGE